MVSYQSIWWLITYTALLGNTTNPYGAPVKRGEGYERRSAHERQGGCEDFGNVTGLVAPKRRSLREARETTIVSAARPPALYQ